MSRSCYSDDYGDDFPGQLELYRANVERSIRSRKGQARLRELRDALVAMPVKALEADMFLRPSGEACALGVWASQHQTDPDTRARMEQFDGDDGDTAQMLAPLGWPRLVVLDLVYENDRTEYLYDEVLGPHQSPYAYQTYSGAWPVRYRRDETPEERYTRVLAWVNEHITE